jgi:hypothetical protein
MELASPALSTQHSFLERIIGAMLLRSDIYDEIKRDPNATFQAAIVVLLGSIAGIFQQSMDNPIWVAFIPLNLIFWPLMAAKDVICAKYFLARRTTWEMADWYLRTSGFVFAPNLLMFVIPAEGPVSLLRLLVFFWNGAAGVIALRQGLQLGSTGRALWVWFGSAFIAGAATAIWLFVAVVTLAIIVA